MTPSPPPPPLTVVAATLLLACARVASVEPVVRLVSDFAAAFLRLPMVKAAAKGNERLFSRVVHYQETALVMSTAVRSSQYARVMRKAVEKKQVDIVRCIHAAHPGRLGVRSFVLAVDALQWLFGIAMTACALTHRLMSRYLCQRCTVACEM